MISTALTLYNTLSRKKELFKPLKISEVGLYTCGPTVYNYAHIGNLRAYIFDDLLKRTLLFNDFKVKHVMNITDVGHLTSDADVGEDKMLKGAQREKKTVWEIAEFYTDAFKHDLKKLNIIKPDIWCRATDHITEQIDMVQLLEKKGFTYNAGGNVYFDTSKLKDYGKLARLDLKKAEEKAKARTAEDKNKKHPHDFVLWFTKSKFLDQEMKWKSPYGLGYPGWHLECSAMSSKYLGQQFDIHCGGIDHIQVHHTNEIAQSEAAFGKKPWVKYWLHNEFLVISKDKDDKETKMSKSGDNFITLSVVEKKGFHPLDYRYLCLGTHYRNPLMFSWEALEAAKNARERLFAKILEIKAKHDKDNNDKYKNNNDKDKNNKDNDKDNKDDSAVLKKYRARFAAEIDDDLNTSKALATLWEVLKDDSLTDHQKLTAHQKYRLALEFDQVLGFGLDSLKQVKKEKIPSEITKLAEERNTARKNKDWKRSDELRDLIRNKGYLIEDTADGFEIKKK